MSRLKHARDIDRDGGSTATSIALPVVVRTDPLPGYEDLDFPDYRIRCGDCDRLRNGIDWRGFADNGRCTVHSFHPDPDRLRHCPQFQARLCAEKTPADDSAEP